VIGPVLFLVMINDLVVSDPKVRLSIFADDCSLDKWLKYHNC